MIKKDGVERLNKVFGKEFIDEMMANFHLKIYEFKQTLK